MSYLRELYQEVIIDHSKHPRNYGLVAEANHLKQGFNPLCGDKLTITLLEKDGVIADIRFEGCGCAISMASASLMTEAVKGKTVAEFENLFTHFHQAVTGSVDTDTLESLGKLAVLAGVAEFPARVKCASLAWHTLKASLHDDPLTVSTE